MQRRSKFHVASVSVPSLHPVLNAQEFSPEFSHPFVPIWRAHQDTKTSVPVTIDIARAMTFVFALDRVVIPSTFNQKGFALKVDLLIDEKLSTHLLHVESISSSNGQPTIVTTSVAIEWDKRAPKAFIGSATFYAVSTPGNEKIGLVSSNVEIYAISRSLPSYLSHNGIHREFLRLVVPSFRNEMVQSFQDYISYASDILHNRTGMVYDIYGGGSSYYSQIDLRTVEGTFNLSKWVSRRRLLRPENNNLAFHVNCFDQAGIVQIALSLGILDKEQGKLLAMTYLRPFGFIKETHLVGWGPCNNPLPRVGDGLVVPQDSPTRQPFSSHMFISYDGNVVDATCGPTYIHFTGLQGYLNKAIDRTTKCYSKESWPAKRDDAKLFLSRLSGGLVKDARGGAGITKVDGFKSSRPDQALSKDVESFLKQLGLPARIEADDTISKQGHEALSYGQLTEALKFLTIDQMGVTVQEEKPMREPGGTALLTWIIITAEKDPQLRVVYLRIYVCPSETIAAQTMEHYLSDHLHGYKDKYVREKTGKSFGRRHLVSSPHNQSGAHLWVAGRLAIVLTGLSNSEALRPIADVIQDFLDMPLPPNKTGGLGPAKVSKGDQVMEVGEVVEVSVNVSRSLHDYTFGPSVTLTGIGQGCIQVLRYLSHRSESIHE